MAYSNIVFNANDIDSVISTIERCGFENLDGEMFVYNLQNFIYAYIDLSMGTAGFNLSPFDISINKYNIITYNDVCRFISIVEAVKTNGTQELFVKALQALGFHAVQSCNQIVYRYLHNGITHNSLFTINLQTMCSTICEIDVNRESEFSCGYDNLSDFLSVLSKKLLKIS